MSQNFKFEIMPNLIKKYVNYNQMRKQCLHLKNWIGYDNNFKTQSIVETFVFPQDYN